MEVEQCIFKFFVASKDVGLLVYRLRSFECALFKIHFHLWNEKGATFARKSTLVDRGPIFEWEEVRSKKGSRPPSPRVPAVFNRIRSDLHIPRQPTPQQRNSVFSQISFNNIPDSAFEKSPPLHSKIWMPKSQIPPSSQKHTVDSSLNLGVQNFPLRASFKEAVTSNLNQIKKATFAEAVSGPSNFPLSGASLVPLGSHWRKVSLPQHGKVMFSSLGRSDLCCNVPRSRCLSSRHSRAACKSCICCTPLASVWDTLHLSVDSCLGFRDCPTILPSLIKSLGKILRFPPGFGPPCHRPVDPSPTCQRLTLHLPPLGKSLLCPPALLLHLPLALSTFHPSLLSSVWSLGFLLHTLLGVLLPSHLVAFLHRALCKRLQIPQYQHRRCRVSPHWSLQ